jgi:hypothetical protein
MSDDIGRAIDRQRAEEKRLREAMKQARERGADAREIARIQTALDRASYYGD